jgi:taurine dioxygenase
MTKPTLIVRRSSGALGAEIAGIDLSAEFDDTLLSEIRRVLLDHLVVFFRDQDLTAAQFLAFARRFGTVAEYPFIAGLPDYPEVIEVKKLEHERVNFGGIWHSDTTYLEEPPMGSLLLAREVPQTGGDTLFANMYLAYETLSTGMRQLLERLSAVSSSAKADVSRTREDRVATSPKPASRTVYEAHHPVVRTHPETGRKALYVNIAHTLRFTGMTEEESAPLLGFLFHQQVKPEFTCRFHWQRGSIAFWDNRAVQHNPINDYHGQRRVMHRITIAGDRPR